MARTRKRKTAPTENPTKETKIMKSTFQSIFIDEIVIEILSFLNWNEKIKTSRINSQWRYFSTLEETWKNYFTIFFSIQHQKTERNFYLEFCKKMKQIPRPIEGQMGVELHGAKMYKFKISVSSVTQAHHFAAKLFSTLPVKNNCIDEDNHFYYEYDIYTEIEDYFWDPAVKILMYNLVDYIMIEDTISNYRLYSYQDEEKNSKILIPYITNDYVDLKDVKFYNEWKGKDEFEKGKKFDSVFESQGIYLNSQGVLSLYDSFNHEIIVLYFKK